MLTPVSSWHKLQEGVLGCASDERESRDRNMFGWDHAGRFGLVALPRVPILFMHNNACAL
jgi:hypothetical protein